MLKEHKMASNDRLVITLPDKRKFRGFYVTQCDDAIRLGAGSVHFFLSKEDLTYKMCRKGVHYLELLRMPMLHNMWAFEKGISKS